MSNPRKCLVIGNGVMGRGSAIGARRIFPEVTMFGVLNACAGSAGSSRIVRTDYGNAIYSGHATSGSKLLKTEYPEFVHECGSRFQVYTRETMHILTAINRTRVQSGQAECTTKTAEEVQKAYGATGDFKRKYGEGAVYVYNDKDYVLNWKGVMDSMLIGYAIESREEEVLDLEMSLDRMGFGTVTRITTKTLSYDVKPDDKVILALGGWLSPYMKRWGIPELPASHQPSTVVIISYDIKLNSKEYEKVKDKCIFSVIGSIEFVPPASAEEPILKVTWLEHKFRSSVLPDPGMLDGSAIMRLATRRVQENLRDVFSELDDVDLLGQAQFDSQSDSGMPIIASLPKVPNMMVCGNGNLTVAKLASSIPGFVENALLGCPDFGLDDPIGAHLQPALRTDKPFEEVEKLAIEELEREELKT